MSQQSKLYRQISESPNSKLIIPKLPLFLQKDRHPTMDNTEEPQCVDIFQVSTESSHLLISRPLPLAKRSSPFPLVSPALRTLKTLRGTQQAQKDTISTAPTLSRLQPHTKHSTTRPSRPRRSITPPKNGAHPVKTHPPNPPNRDQRPDLRPPRPHRPPNPLGHPLPQPTLKQLLRLPEATSPPHPQIPKSTIKHRIPGPLLRPHNLPRPRQPSLPQLGARTRPLRPRQN